MMKTHRSLLMLSLLVASQAIAGLATLRAGDFTLQNTRDYKGSTLGEGHFDRSNLIFTFDARVGYDDNTLAEPEGRFTTVVYDPVLKQSRTVTHDQSTSDSAFLNFDIGVGYSLASPRATFSIGADVGVNYYFDRPGRDYDINSGVNAAFSYKLTPRAVIDVTSYSAYTSEPDFGASNNTNFGGGSIGGLNNISGVTSADRRNGDFFYTSNRLALTYQWAPRFSTVTGYNLVAFAYRSNQFSISEDRVEHYFSQQVRYLVSPLVTAVGEYRFGYVDYFNVNNDSFQHFVLGGADFNISQRLHGMFRAGAQFRDYYSYDDNTVSPYVEGSLVYNLSRLANVSFLARYSNEEGDITTTNNNSDTLRMGVSYQQSFGLRLSGYVSFYYTHSEFSGPDTFLTDQTGALVLSPNNNRIVVYPGNFNENTFDVAAGLRFAFNRMFSAEAGYTHTTVLSGIDVREYDRNRYFGGIRITF